MQKALEIARKISSQLDKNWLKELEELNLHKIFAPIYLSQHDVEIENAIVCYIIYAYDNDSKWINISSDRLSDKIAIMKGLNVDITEKPFCDILLGDIEDIQDVIADYLTSITTWKWRTIITCFDYHAINIKAATEATKSMDELEAAKINKAKGELLKEAIRQREVGEHLLKEIKSEFVKTDRATQQDFGFEITDEKKINPESWRDFIRYTKPKLEQKEN